MVEVSTVFQHFLVEKLPVGAAAKTKKIEGMRDIAVCKATHDEALCKLVVHNIFKRFTTILELTGKSTQAQLRN